MYIILMTTKFEIKDKDKKGKIKIIEFYSHIFPCISYEKKA